MVRWQRSKRERSGRREAEKKRGANVIEVAVDKSSECECEVSQF
jgi:hypothetical protein